MSYIEEMIPHGQFTGMWTKDVGLLISNYIFTYYASSYHILTFQDLDFIAKIFYFVGTLILERYVNFICIIYYKIYLLKILF